MKIPKATQELIDRLCKAAYVTELKKDVAEKLIEKLYLFHNLTVPKIEWCVDITDERLLGASRASSASSASSASWASWASRASWASLASRASIDYDFDYFIFIYSHEWNE